MGSSQYDLPNMAIRGLRHVHRVYFKLDGSLSRQVTHLWWPINKQNGPRAEKQQNFIFCKLIGKLSITTVNSTKETYFMHNLNI